jgi:hypothetical protein
MLSAPGKKYTGKPQVLFAMIKEKYKDIRLPYQEDLDAAGPGIIARMEN